MKYPKVVNEQILIVAVVDTTWIEGHKDDNVHEELLARCRLGLEPKYKVGRFSIMSLNVHVNVTNPKDRKRRSKSK